MPVDSMIPQGPVAAGDPQESDNAKRLKILMSAFFCDPSAGSEAGVGWNWAVQAVHDHDVWVLTLSRHRESIERHLEANPIEGLHFIYWEVPGWPKRLEPWWRFIRQHYILWQLTVPMKALSTHRRLKFDVVHHTTMNTIEMPGLLWLLGIPHVWGPIGGAQEPPKVLRHYYGGEWTGEFVRIVRKRLVRLNPVVQLALRRSRIVMAANSDTERLIRACGVSDVIRELEAAIHPIVERTAPTRNSNEPLTILWSGRMIPGKGPDLALDVMDELRKRNVAVRMLMAGEGPAGPNVDERIQTLDLGAFVTRLGELPHSEMSEFYRRGHAYLFTSLRDTSGNVVLEAMSHGMPVVTLDHHGVADIVTSESGIKIPIHNRRQVITDLATAIERLIEDPIQSAAMGRAAQRRIDECYTWSHKRDLLTKIYRAATRSRQQSPRRQDRRPMP